MALLILPQSVIKKKKKGNYQLQIVPDIISLNFILLETPEVVTIIHIFSIRKWDSEIQIQLD